MGEFLSVPIKDKVSEDNENSIVQTFNLVKIRCMRDARMAQAHGGLSY